ncbi:5'-methylthioadenosine/S-adenosylhomocysteine nucleosidase family protein [Aquisphaera insulae]|uniref:5'-methylthioadenosine/S-adenosylhomocysteine nucleosidase family protein n=1 Tax=Aquisphaera insulae TaxID=2712864 RepID=UPI0013EDAB75|nr:5'-methylthioadenosine/S-adenosylhomocysteine nucleosidase [Aquisphaera insulae]
MSAASPPMPPLEQLEELAKALTRFLWHDESSFFAVPRAQEAHRLPGFLRVADTIRPLRDLQETSGWPPWLKEFIPQLIKIFDVLAYTWGWGELLKPEEVRAAYIQRRHEQFRESYLIPIQEAARLCRMHFSSIDCPSVVEELCETIPPIDFDLMPRMNPQDRLDPLWDAIYRKQGAFLLGESFPSLSGAGGDAEQFAPDRVLGEALKFAHRKLERLVAQAKAEQRTSPTEQPPLRPVLELPFYLAEDQPWHGALPEVREAAFKDLISQVGQIDLILFTVTDIELHAALRLVEPLPRRKFVQKGFVQQETYYLGRLGTCNMAVTKCRMGSVGSGSAELATQHAIQIWRPRAIIMAGIAFGKEPAKQRIADVLVASEIIPYEPQRVGEALTIRRGAVVPASTTLLNRFDNVPHWSFSRPDRSPSGKVVGPVLSGEKLVDDLAFKSSLFNAHPTAIGGEMEGAGLAAAAHRHGVPWIMAKGICDWADGAKHDSHQPLAAAAAMSLVHNVLSQADVLHGLEKKIL